MNDLRILVCRLTEHVTTATSTTLQEAQVLDLEHSTSYEFRVQPALVTSACGEIVEEGEAGNASAFYDTDCTGDVYSLWDK